MENEEVSNIFCAVGLRRKMPHKRFRTGMHGVFMIFVMLFSTFLSSFLSFATLFTTCLLFPPLVAWIAGKRALAYGMATNLIYWLAVLIGNIHFDYISTPDRRTFWWLVNKDMADLVFLGFLLAGMGLVCSLPVHFAQRRARGE